MADETHDEKLDDQTGRPKRITLTGRRFGRTMNFGGETVELAEEDESLPSRPRRDTAERRRAS